MSKIRILLVENHLLLRHQIGRLLRIPENVEVVAEVSDVAEALKIVEQEGVDLILMDLAIPGMRGMETVRQFKQAAPGIKVIVLLPMDSGEYRAAATRNGVDACVQKDRIGTALLPLIQRNA